MTLYRAKWPVTLQLGNHLVGNFFVIPNPLNLFGLFWGHFPKPQSPRFGGIPHPTRRKPHHQGWTPLLCICSSRCYFNRILRKCHGLPQEIAGLIGDVKDDDPLIMALFLGGRWHWGKLGPLDAHHWNPCVACEQWCVFFVGFSGTKLDSIFSHKMGPYQLKQVYHSIYRGYKLVHNW